MSLNTYDGLKASVANWLNRTDLATEIPDFIELAEERLINDVRASVLEKTTTVTSVSATGETDVPSDFVELKNVFYNQKPLSRITLTELKSYQATAGTPVYFSRDTTKFVLFPTPTMSGTDALIFIYYKSIIPLSSSNTTNEILQLSPQAYLYATLVAAANFLGSDSSRWESGYQSALSRIIMQERSAEFSGSTPQISNGY
jgi:hypothetical protein